MIYIYIYIRQTLFKKESLFLKIKQTLFYKNYNFYSSTKLKLMNTITNLNGKVCLETRVTEE